MKKKTICSILSLLGLSAAVLAFGGCEKNENDTADVFVPPVIGEEYELPFAYGVNVNGLEQDWNFNRAMRYLSEESTYTGIRAQGFDHIRIPVDFRRFYSSKTKTLDEKQMTKFDNILDLAEAAGLYATVDFHGWYDLNPDVPAQKEMFLTIWRLVAERYKDRSERIAFELINEPGIGTMSAKQLNELQAEAIAVIRETNPERLIICAAADANQPWMLGELVLPAGDENLAVAVHIYHPGAFTHQGFTWANPPREAGVQVRLDDEMMGDLQWNLDETQKFIDSTGIPVILNEFGLNLELADEADVSLYLRTITEFCKKNGVPWTFWEYNQGEMALYRGEKWDKNTLDALFLR